MSNIFKLPVVNSRRDQQQNLDNLGEVLKEAYEVVEETQPEDFEELLKSLDNCAGWLVRRII